MSAFGAGCSSVGEKSVKAGDGLDEAATDIAAPATAASIPAGAIRQTIIFLHFLQGDGTSNALLADWVSLRSLAAPATSRHNG